MDAAHVAERADEIGGPFTCSRDRAASLWSDSRRALREPDDALRLTPWPRSRPHLPTNATCMGSERMACVQVVKAHIQRRELNGAAEQLAPAPEHRARPLLYRVAEVRTMVAHYARVARGITTSVTAFGRHPARAELTPCRRSAMEPMRDHWW